MTKIGIDARELSADQMTGIGRYLSNFLENVSLDEGHREFLLFGNQKTTGLSRFENFPQQIIREDNTFWWDQIKLRKELRENEINVFFSPYYKAPLWSPCPFVITIHDIMFLTLPEYQGRLHSIYRRLVESIAHRATKIITVSEFSKGEIVKRLSIADDGIAVVPNCVSGRFRPCDDETSVKETREKHGIAREYILYAGNFCFHKNVRGLVRAFASLPERLRSRYQLVLAGKKDDGGEQVAQIARELGIERDVIFAGFVADEELPTLYGGAALFATFSTYEGFCLPLVEAMACGVPVLASSLTAIPEVVGDAALLVNPLDIEESTAAMKKILEDEQLAKELKEKGFRRAAEFNPQNTAAKILAVLNEAAR